MHLFSEKYSTNLKYYSFLFEYTVKCNLSCKYLHVL